MMRSQNIFVIASLFCILPLVTIQPQIRTGLFSVGGVGSIGIPVWKDDPVVFMDDFGLGLGFGGELKINVTRFTQLGGRMIYQTFRPDFDGMKEEIEVRLKEGGAVEDVHGSMIVGMITGSLIQHVGSTGFYLTAGGGYYLYKSGKITFEMTQIGYAFEHEEELDTENGYGFNGGFGLEKLISRKLSFFIEGKYHHVFREEAKEAAKDVGKASFILLVTGLRYFL